MQIRARVFGPLTPVDPVLAREAHDYLLKPSIVNATFDYWCRQTHHANLAPVAR
ncbi:class II aldolase/adducin domain protein [Afipia felis]|uniref:Class II aldolase/adducin domain protein n=3 Tax=Afipia TaxID=1033 RepID=A0A090N849_AFIFE|nr:class II aldolase/adducin domain protein [Afipia felis]